MSPPTDGFVTVAKVGEIRDGGVKIVRLDDQSVAVFHVRGSYYAIDDVCTHDGGPLAEGVLDDVVIECPRHGARFDVTTGEVLCAPAITPVPTYAVRVVGDEIQVGVGMSDERDVNPGSPAPAAARPPESIDAVTPSPGSEASPPAAAEALAKTAAPTQQELAVRSALETVMDPEIGLSVIDLGLIREIHLFDDRSLVRMMLTTPFCPYAPQIMAEVKEATMGVVSKPCEVEILPDAWSPDLMPDPGLLGYSF